MIRSALAAFTLGLVILSQGQADAHGLGVRRLHDAKTVTVEFHYSGGSAMAYGEARAFSPDAPDVPATNGRADRLGRFSFVPDTTGEWKVVGKDSDGHQATVSVMILDDAATVSRWRQPHTWLLFGSLGLNLLLAILFVDQRRRQAAISV